MQCYFCANKIEHVDYKEIEMLKKFTDQFARIAKKRGTGTCAKHQRKLAKAIKHARFFALVPFIAS